MITQQHGAGLGSEKLSKRETSGGTGSVTGLMTELNCDIDYRGEVFVVASPGWLGSKTPSFFASSSSSLLLGFLFFVLTMVMSLLLSD